MRIGKVSVLFCMVAPVLGVTVARFAPTSVHEASGLGPVALGLAVFAALTAIGGIIGVIAHLRGSRAGAWTIGWSVLALAGTAYWFASGA